MSARISILGEGRAKVSNSGCCGVVDAAGCAAGAEGCAGVGLSGASFVGRTDIEGVAGDGCVVVVWAAGPDAICCGADAAVGGTFCCVGNGMEVCVFPDVGACVFGGGADGCNTGVGAASLVGCDDGILGNG